MRKDDVSEIRSYLNQLAPYQQISKLVASLHQECSLVHNFSWIDQEQVTVKKEILGAIGQVADPRTRAMMAYKFVDGLTIDEIAIKLQVSNSLCYKRITKAYREITLPMAPVQNLGGKNMIRGTVKWFDKAKGYGFITSAGEEDIFVHASDIEGEGFKNLDDGQQVEYVVGEFNGRRRAVSVSVVG